jgi:hypothetical protein
MELAQWGANVFCGGRSDPGGSATLPVFSKCLARTNPDDFKVLELWDVGPGTCIEQVTMGADDYCYYSEPVSLLL